MSSTSLILWIRWLQNSVRKASFRVKYIFMQTPHKLKSKRVKNRIQTLVDRGQRRKQGPHRDNGLGPDVHKRNDEEWNQASFVNIKDSLIPRPVNGVRGHPPGGSFLKRASTVIAGVTTVEGRPWHNSTLWTGLRSNPSDWKTPMIPGLMLGLQFGKRWLWGIILEWEHPKMESA
ncbi:hypothetical protein NPIL_325181 [Nephila pilipes]|uniref:Uncharacterized protein n=1 Tax=Nephila pilipes TaxID=299642 RepID=A0A8X6MUG0_NEPPI|nr:hypothetical protein NPIL_325181 [Nephila pilipes]